MAVLSLATIIIITASSFNTVFALVSFTEHMSAYGSTVINIAGHPHLLIDAYHFDSGEFASGDVLRVFYYQETSQGPMFQNVAVFTNMPDRVPFLQQLFVSTPTLIQLVSASDLEVSRKGNSKTIMIVWKTPLQVPTETWEGPIPEFIVPPGRLILRGHGETVYGGDTKTSDNWLQTLTWKSYYANATFACPTWHFGGPVGENDGQNPTTIFTDATLVSAEVS